MQYAQMVDLLEKARQAGEQETDSLADQLASLFDGWINRQDLREITQEEEEALRESFYTGVLSLFLHPK